MRGERQNLGLAEEAVLAGEGSGGIAILPLGVAYDGLLALGLFSFGNIVHTMEAQVFGNGGPVDFPHSSECFDFNLLEFTRPAQIRRTAPDARSVASGEC